MQQDTGGGKWSSRSSSDEDLGCILSYKTGVECESFTSSWKSWNWTFRKSVRRFVQFHLHPVSQTTPNAERHTHTDNELIGCCWWCCCHARWMWCQFCTTIVIVRYVCWQCKSLTKKKIQIQNIFWSVCEALRLNKALNYCPCSKIQAHQRLSGSISTTLTMSPSSWFATFFFFCFF